MKSFLCSRTIPLILFFLLTIMSGYSYAQTYTLNGRITDEKNRQPLAFVNVVINDGQVGTISDIDGKYSIESTQPIHKVQTASSPIAKLTTPIHWMLTVTISMTKWSSPSTAVALVKLWTKQATTLT